MRARANAGVGAGGGVREPSLAKGATPAQSALPRQGGTWSDLAVVVSPAAWDAGTDAVMSLRATQGPVERH